MKTTLSLIRTFSNKTFKREKLFSVTGPMVDLNLIPQAQVCAFTRHIPDLCVQCSFPRLMQVRVVVFFTTEHVDHIIVQTTKTIMDGFWNTSWQQTCQIIGGSKLAI